MFYVKQGQSVNMLQRFGLGRVAKGIEIQGIKKFFREKARIK